MKLALVNYRAATKGDQVAREVIERLTDDLDNSEATVTIKFAIDGDPREIDLNDRNAEKFRKAMEPYLKASRSLLEDRPKGTGRGRPKGSKNKAPSAPRDFEPAAVRVWADEKGIKLSPKGRIPADIVERYKADTQQGQPQAS